MRHTRYIGDWSSDVCSSDLTRRLLRAGAASVGKSADAAGRSACATLLFGEESGDIGGASGFLRFAEADALQHLSVVVLAAGKLFGAFFEEGDELLARRSVASAGADEGEEGSGIHPATAGQVLEEFVVI